MSKEEIRQLITESADEIYNKNNSTVYEAISIIEAEILNNVEELLAAALFQMQEDLQYIKE